MPTHSLSERERWRLNEGPAASAREGGLRSVDRCQERLARANKQLAKAELDFAEVVADIAELKAGSRTGATVVRDSNGIVTGITTP